MNNFWRKFFFVGNWVANGSSYLSPNTYAILHRLHHAHADTELDPHSPKYDKGIMAMMLRTRDEYLKIFHGKVEVEPKYKKNLPGLHKLDKFFEHVGVRLIWVVAYAVFFYFFATAWWQWAFLPLTIVMGPLHGVIINWFSHKVGYRNFEVSNTSTNMLPWDLIMWGEALHNNHHKRGSNPNFAYKKWEFDPMWPLIKGMSWVGIIKLQRQGVKKEAPEIQLNQDEAKHLGLAISKIPFPEINIKGLPEEKLQHLMDAWSELVKTDWRGNMNDYLKSIHARQAIQDFLDSAGASVRGKVQNMVEPVDKAFKARMKPWDDAMKKHLAQFKNGEYFWVKYSVYTEPAL